MVLIRNKYFKTISDKKPKGNNMRKIAIFAVLATVTTTSFAEQTKKTETKSDLEKQAASLNANITEKQNKLEKAKTDVLDSAEAAKQYVKVSSEKAALDVKNSGDAAREFMKNSATAANEYVKDSAEKAKQDVKDSAAVANEYVKDSAEKAYTKTADTVRSATKAIKKSAKKSRKKSN